MKSLLILALPLLLVCTGAALAQTPDGETPAQEAVCDDETGAAYGLCNAYCEAMDCESDDPQASETACTRVKDKFTQITGRDLPCEKPACPCAAHPAWDSVISGQNHSCSVSGTSIAFASLSGFINVRSGSCGAFPSTSAPVQLSITPEEGAACFELLLTQCPAG
ncbi:MAG TPA: hypothetical protein VF789_16740 [Thermoanaerobaculia bacterium]